MSIGTPLSPSATRVLLLGSGELGKEVAIELQRLGCEVIACDRYPGAPAMQVAHRSHVFSMLDGDELRRVVELEQPHLVVPEIEAIATEVLLALEAEGVRVVPTARAANLTMNREGIRRFAAEELGLPTSPYRFVGSEDELADAVAALGYPAVIKPIMSSSGKGQSVVRGPADLAGAWAYAQEGGRAGAGRCIVEGFVTFDYEITALTVAAVNGVQCCPPIGHLQIDGDYRESWQPMPMTEAAWVRAQEIAKAVVGGLGGHGIFGVELFVRGDDVIFSEVSPRPHDTGLVTLGSQDMSEFALHARAVLGLPVPPVRLVAPAASVPLLGSGTGVPRFHGVDAALAEPGTQVRLFGKPRCEGKRRLAVCVATADSVEGARAKAAHMAAAVTISLDPEPPAPAGLDRKPPRLQGGELETVLALLQFQRESVVRKVEAIDDAAAGRSVVPTGTSLLWLLQHLADAESLWVLQRFAGRPAEPPTAGQGDTVAAAVDRYRGTWARVDAVVTAAPSLDELTRDTGSESPVNLRWVLMHLLEETARHAGHADILRELLDGRTGR